MNKRFLPLLLVTLALTVLALARTGEAAYAQGCTDPAGNPIPCPNPDKKTPTPVPPRTTATFTPTATVSSPSEPTATLLIVNPTDSGSTESDGDDKITCFGGESSLKKCIGDFVYKCVSEGGAATVSKPTDEHAVITCSKPVFNTIPTPDAETLITIPTADGSSDGAKPDWDYFCDGFDDENPLTTCLQFAGLMCQGEGGTTTVTFDKGNAIVTCKHSVIAATPEAGSVINPSGPTPRPGGTFPPGGWLPWITGLGGLIAGLMLLPAVQKIRNAASRTARMPNNKNPDLMKSNEDQDPTAQKKAKRTEAEFSNKAEPTSQTREHVLLAKQDGEQGNSRPYRLFGDADGDSPPPPPPPPQNNAPAEGEGMQLKAKRAEIAPQTREHILLANQPTDPSEAKSKPKPPPPPPSGVGSDDWLGAPLSVQDGSADGTRAENNDSLTTGRDDVITREDKDKG